MVFNIAKQRFQLVARLLSESFVCADIASINVQTRLKQITTNHFDAVSFRVKGLRSFLISF